LARDHHLFVEALDACAPPPVGCGELAGMDPRVATTLGAVLAGKAPGRRNDQEIAVYKAMGIGMEDMVVANMVFQRAEREQVGSRMDW
jgi:ornithine cyclodeaminase/alanine dehydrogenase-like protein (mu-crystallin family)